MLLQLVTVTIALLGTITIVQCDSQCRPVYVRWPRVRVAFGPRREGPFSLTACKSACSAGEDPLSAGRDQPCAGFNQRQGPNQYTHHCQIYESDQLMNVDGFVEADDRYSFYWKYCVNTERTCSGDYAFTFVSDRYMDEREVVRVSYSTSLEQCLAACLGEQSFACRSVSFNRSDGGCHLSDQNQLSKPGLIRLNNNPNFRIDYYENNCFNSNPPGHSEQLISVTDTFAFDYECRDDGILIKVESKYPYTGALYGLYDFFTCRIEPHEENRFQFLFPSPSESKNCSDSIRYKGNDMILEVVLSTDGVEPLYFITPDDLTYQARCPINNNRGNVNGKDLGNSIDFHPSYSESKNASVDLRQFQASAHALFSLLAKESNHSDNTSPVSIVNSTTLPPVINSTALPLTIGNGQLRITVQQHDGQLTDKDDDGYRLHHFVTRTFTAAATSIAPPLDDHVTILTTSTMLTVEDAQSTATTDFSSGYHVYGNMTMIPDPVPGSPSSPVPLQPPVNLWLHHHHRL